MAYYKGINYITLPLNNLKLEKDIRFTYRGFSLRKYTLKVPLA